MSISRLEKFLWGHKSDGSYYTHVSLGERKGKYAMDRADLEKFWGMYLDIVAMKRENPGGKDSEGKDFSSWALTLAEKVDSTLPILIDIDLKVARNPDQIDPLMNLYSLEDVKKIIKVYQQTIVEILEDVRDTHLVCILLEKPGYSITKGTATYFKNGFHLHFPGCFIDKVDQETQLIPRVKEKLDKMGLFDNVCDISGDPSKYLDTGYLSAPWLLYGCSKSEGSGSYLVTKAFNEKCEEIKLDDSLRYYDLYDMQERRISMRGNIEYNLPRILSVNIYGREACVLKHGLISPLRERMRDSPEYKLRDYGDQTVEEKLSVARKLLPLLADFRSEDRNDWMTIGWALYNIGDGSTEALNLWCDFSSRAGEKYDENVCIYQWERMVGKNISIGTIRHFASIDNPEKYKLIKKMDAKDYFESAIEGGAHNDVAKMLFAEYGDTFVCCSITTKNWFRFYRGYWHNIDNGIDLRRVISSDLVTKFADKSVELTREMANANDAQKNTLHNQVKFVNKMVMNLKSSPYKNNVMNECAEVFYNKNFSDKMNTDPALFPFKNGVYDLRTCVFRPGRPEDYISNTAPINYVEFSQDDERVASVRDFLDKIFPDTSLRNYFMDVTSDIFWGGNTQKQVYFWTGDGDNGKSVTQNILEKMLGKLSIKFNTTVITGKKVQSGSANPELARSGGGVRLATLEEPNNDEMINIGTLKNLSGNDSFYARDLFEKGKEGREIVPMFKLVFICNKLPTLKHNDKAVWNRIRVIDFESTFCRASDPAPETHAEQMKTKRFPMDPNFGEKIPSLLEPFAWMLLEHRKTVPNIRVEPLKVTEATDRFRTMNDNYAHFVRECIEEKKGCKLSILTIHKTMRNWYKESFGNSNACPNKFDVEAALTKKWGEYDENKTWHDKTWTDAAIKEGLVSGMSGLNIGDDMDDDVLADGLPQM